MWVSVAVPGESEPLSFIFDTGASVSVLDLETCRRLKLRLGSPVAVNGLGGDAKGFWPVRFKAAAAGDNGLPTKYLGIDLSELSEACERRVDGLLGADMLGNQVVELDFAKGRIRIRPAKDFVPGIAAEKIALKRTSGGILAPLRVNGNPVEWFRIDTGCTSELHWVNRAAAAAAGEKTGAAGVGEEELGLAEVSATLGSQRLVGLEAALHSKPIFKGEAGLLGTGVLTNYLVAIDMKRAHLFLENYSYQIAAARVN